MWLFFLLFFARGVDEKNLVVAGGYLPPLSLAARSKNDYKNPTG